jgi:hypothetical protein
MDLCFTPHIKKNPLLRHTSLQGLWFKFYNYLACHKEPHETVNAACNLWFPGEPTDEKSFSSSVGLPATHIYVYYNKKIITAGMESIKLFMLE